MAIYIITYDLRNESGSADYQPLWDELAQRKCHRTQDSVWLCNLNNTAHEVHDHFKAFVDPDDRLMVAEYTKNSTYSNARGGTNDWLANNPPSR